MYMDPKSTKNWTQWVTWTWNQPRTGLSGSTWTWIWVRTRVEGFHGLESTDF